MHDLPLRRRSRRAYRASVRSGGARVDASLRPGPRLSPEIMAAQMMSRRGGFKPYYGLRIGLGGPRLYGGIRLAPHLSIGTSAGPFSPGRGGKAARGASHLFVALAILAIMIWAVGRSY
jgi:hypothetical protein